MPISRREQKRCLTYCWLMWKHWHETKLIVMVIAAQVNCMIVLSGLLVTGYIVNAKIPLRVQLSYVNNEVVI